MTICPFDHKLWPGDLGKNSQTAADRWREKIRTVDIEAVMARYVQSYVLAIECNPRVRVLGHMGDGLVPMRSFEIPVEKLGEKRLLHMMEPLFRACAKSKVLWECTAQPVQFPSVLHRANEIGVHFSATADAHFLKPEGWANLRDHAKAEEYIGSLGLTKGVLFTDGIESVG
jgi:hypothetical protein